MSYRRFLHRDVYKYRRLSGILKNSIEHSLILESTSIENVDKLEESL